MCYNIFGDEMKKVIAIGLSLISFVYTLWYMSYGNPVLNSGALSKIGLKHHTEFVIWGVLTFVALSFNIIIAYRDKTKNKVYIPLLIIAGIGMALTLCFDFDYYKKPDYYFHCVGSLAFSVIMGITIFILFALLYYKDMLYKVFTYITTGILIIDLIFLLIFKETGLIEALPIFAGYLLLGFTNLRRDKIEAIK